MLLGTRRNRNHRSRPMLDAAPAVAAVPVLSRLVMDVGGLGGHDLLLCGVCYHTIICSKYRANTLTT